MEFKQLKRKELNELIAQNISKQNKFEIKIKLNTQERASEIEYHYDFFVGPQYLGKDGDSSSYDAPNEDPLRMKIKEVEEFLKAKEVKYSIKKQYHGRENESGEAIIKIKAPKKEQH